MAQKQPRGIIEWTQDSFIRAGEHLQSNKSGGFSEGSGLLYDKLKRKLEILPEMTDKGGFISGFSSPTGAYYQHAEEFTYFGGSDASNNFAQCIYAADFSDDSVDSWGTTRKLSGNPGQGTTFIGESFWYLLAGYIYRSSDKTTEFGTAGDDFISLFPSGADVFAIKSEGDIYKLNSSATDFEIYLANTTGERYVTQRATSYNQYIVLFVQDDSGRLRMYRVQDTFAQKWHEVLTVANSQMPELTHQPFRSNLFAYDGEDIYIMRGEKTTATTSLWSVYRIGENFLSPIASIAAPFPIAASGTNSTNIHIWRNRIVCTLGTAVYIMVGSQFVEWKVLSSLTHNYTSSYVAGNNLLVVGKNSGGTETFWYSDETKLITGGYVVTSKLHMGTSGTLKLLHSLTVILDANTDDAGHTTTVEYRIDDTAAWTTAINAQQGLFLRSVDDLKDPFYLLQIKVTLNNPDDYDVGISAINAIYSQP